MARSEDLKKFRETSFITYLENNGMSFDSEIAKGEKVKLCSSDDFTDVAKEFEEKYGYDKAPVMIGHVGGFYVTASLAGLSEQISATKPYVLFFDRKDANVQNAIYNTLLLKSCSSREQYICKLFNISPADIIKALKPSLYVDYIEEVLSEEYDFHGLTRKEKKEVIQELYEQDKEKIDLEIKENHINRIFIDQILEQDFNLTKIAKYAQKKKYDANEHYELLKKHAMKFMTKKEQEVFLKLASHITSYLSRGDNYQDLIYYLTEDIKKNGDYHILANDDIFEGYQDLFTGRGSYVKFVSGIDISTQKGVEKLEEILKRDGFIGDSVKENDFDIDLAFIPHMNQLKEAYPLLKKHVQDYIMVYRDESKKNNYFVTNSTATLDEKTLESIGASFIEEERKKRVELKNLSPVEERDGYPLLMFMAGSNFGNIYHSEVDTNNMIDMAIANHVDTVYIQGLIYSTYYHFQTSRRLLTDPTYETLDSRLQAAQKVIKKLNKAGIKVVYQMGDEEYNLYQDLFKIYTREQGVKGNDFLKREDVKSKFDWVRPIIIQELIPYMIRSGEDVAGLYTDEETHTNVSRVCNAIKRYKEGLPLGDASKIIKPEFLEDSDMFRVVYSTIDNYSEKDPAIAVNLISSNGRSAKGSSSVVKNLRLYQSGVVDQSKLVKIPQLSVDGKKPFMSISYSGDEFTMNVPQMINDSYYMENPQLLSGIKEHVLQDPTYKRVTQITAKPNYPGGWMISGDIRERMVIVPYYKRVKEVMDYVQRTGKGFEPKTISSFNDWHIGSLAERPDYAVKFLDYLFYECNPTGLLFNGDQQQGSNYGKYPNEARHTGANSMTQQMISHNKLIRPYMREAFGVIQGDFGIESDSCDRFVDDSISRKIIDHLASVGLIENNQGIFHNTARIKRGIDYKTVDLKLPRYLKPYEEKIREKLSKIINLDHIDIVRGNHEGNSDWNFKGYDEIELLRQELSNLQDYSGSDVDLTLTEFFVNGRGDFVNAPYGFRTINGYNMIYSHSFKGGGNSSPTISASRWLSRMAPNLPRIDIINAAHYHMFETSVIDNTLINITGSSSGQSGYEQNLGYSSQPLFVIERFLPDGRISMETIGTEFLDQYQIQNPEIKAKGLDNFIQECMTEKATIFDKEQPKQVQKIYQRKLVPKAPNKIIGPDIDE